MCRALFLPNLRVWPWRCRCCAAPSSPRRNNNDSGRAGLLSFLDFRPRRRGVVRAQEDGEHRAGAEGALDVEKTAMAVEDVLDDREPEPGAAHFARPRGVDAVEPFGQSRQMLAGDALALIAHGYRQKCGVPAIAAVRRPAPCRGRHRDLAAGAAVFDRVVEEVLEQL